MIEEIVNRLSNPAIEKMLSFTEARHRVISENVANIDTPGYRTKQLDPGLFQKALRRAIEAQKREPDAAMTLDQTQEFRELGGRLVTTPSLEPTENLLFHDGTNARIEKEMSELASNTMMHQLSVEFLNNHFRMLKRSITGRTE